MLREEGIAGVGGGGGMQLGGMRPGGGWVGRRVDGSGGLCWRLRKEGVRGKGQLGA